MDIELKYSIWKAYGQRCVYSGNFIDNFDDLEIDHIIPKSEIKANLGHKIIKYEFDKDFDVLRSPENLVPCVKRLNRLKWKRPFDESTERFFINIAKSKLIRIAEERKKFRTKRRKIEDELLLKDLEEKSLPEKKLEFKKEKIITDREAQFLTNHYWNSDTYVSINSFLPSKFDEIGSCVIEFRNNETMISLKHFEIIELINEIKIIDLKDLILRGQSFENTKSFIIIGSNAVHLDNLVFNQLLILLKDFLIEYNKFYNDFERFIQAENFSRKGKSDYYVLSKLSRKNWSKLMEYSKKYDLDNGITEDYFFNYNPNSIIALDRGYNNIKFWLDSGDVVYNTVNSFVADDLYLEVLWRIPSREERVRITPGHVWTADRTYQWIISVIS